MGLLTLFTYYLPILILGLFVQHHNLLLTKNNTHFC